MFLHDEPRMMIKVCGITRRQDALAAVEAGASAIGFVFYPPSPRCVTPVEAAGLSEGLAVSKVGVFVDPTPAELETAIDCARLDVVQIYGEVRGLAPAKVRVWRAMRVAEGDSQIPQDFSAAEAILLDGSRNGMPFDWRIARGAAGKIIVAGGLDASNVAEAIRAAQPWGVDASSGLESSPGKKDAERVRRFVDAARQAFAAQKEGAAHPVEVHALEKSKELS